MITQSTYNPNDLLAVEPQSYPMPDNGKEANSIGVAVEDFAADFFGLEHDRSEHHDARDEQTGTPVQTKGARWRSCNGRIGGEQKYAHGRFRLFECDHEWLAENDGVYAFIVYEKSDLANAIVPVYARILKPAALDDWVFDGEPWYAYSDDVDLRKATGTDYRLSWPKVFPRAEGTL